MSIKDTVVLKKGKWEAGVCARLGGNAIYLRYDGKDILCPLVDEAQIDVNPYLQGDPILLPANRIYLGYLHRFFKGQRWQNSGNPFGKHRLS